MHLLVVFLTMSHQCMVMNHTKSLGYVVNQHERYYIVYHRCSSNADFKPCKIRWLQVGHVFRIVIKINHKIISY